MRGKRLAPFGLQGEIHHHDAVFFHDADQQNNADDGDDGKLQPEGQQGGHGPESGRGQGRQDGQGMDGALVEDAEHDIHRDQGGQKQQGLVLERGLEGLGRAGKGAPDVIGQAHVPARRLDGRRRLGQGRARGQVERDGGGRELPLVADGQGCLAGAQGGHRGQGYLGAVGSGHVNLAQARRGLPHTRLHLQHHPVLVEVQVGHPDQTLAKSAVQGIVQGLDRDPQARRRGPVEIEGGHDALFLLVGADIDQFGQGAHPGLKTRHPAQQVIETVREQRILVDRIARSSAHAQFLGRLEIGRRSGRAGQLAPQPGQGGGQGAGTLAEGHQGDEHPGGVGAAAVAASAAGEAGHGHHVGIGAQDVLHGLEPFFHGLERAVRRGLDEGHDATRILLREKALGNEPIKPDAADQAGRGQKQHEPGMGQGHIEGACVKPVRPLENPLEQEGDPPRPQRPPAQQQSAQHGRCGQGQDQGDKDGHGQHHGEFPKQPPHHAAHEQDRNEDRDQRQAHGDHGERDLAGADHGRAPGAHAGLQMPGHVFKHHNGVVHHEACSDGEGHEGQVVQGIAEQVHDREGADQGGHRGRGRNEGGPQIAEKGEHHEDHKKAGRGQGPLHLGQGGPDGRGAVHLHRELDVGGQGGGKLGQQGPDIVHGLDDVGPGLAEHDQHDGRTAVDQAAGPDILHRIRDPGHVGQTHRGAVFIRKDQRVVLQGLEQLVVGRNLVGGLTRLDLALGPVDRGGGDKIAYLGDTQPPLGQGGRIHVHAHRR